MSRRTFIALGALVITLFVYVGFLFSTGVWNLPSKKQLVKKIQPKEEPKMTAPDANRLALSRALEWKDDAKLFNIISLSGKTGKNTGNSYDWDMLFVSTSTKQEALKIEIRNGQINSIVPVPFYGKGSELPDSSMLIPSEEAIKKVHQIKGYEEASVKSIELVYDPSNKWYWSIKTDKGTSLTVSAEK